jgi:hypothetical protein
MTDPTRRILDIRYVSEHHIAIHWSFVEECEPDSPHTNVVLAAFTTAQARLHLYEVLWRLGRRIVYLDTDSIIYMHENREGAYNPELTPYLGGLKDEMEGRAIAAVSCLGAKNYGIKCADGQTVCKVRGFNLCFRASKTVNYDVMEAMATEPPRRADTHSIHEPRVFKRDGLGGVFSVAGDKLYGMTYDKRIIAADCVDTVPFGWSPG